MMKKFFSLGLFVLISIACFSQPYFPVGDAFVCVDGSNRYTRALYGSHSDWRLETSDRPQFAVAKKGHHRNLAFRLETAGSVRSLDVTTHCRASYVEGRRDYELTDAAWPSGRLSLSVVALPEDEGAVFRFFSAGVSGSVVATVSNILRPKLFRNGDIGVDASDSFDASGSPLQQLSAPLLGGECYFKVVTDSLVVLSLDEGRHLYRASICCYSELAGRLRFSTPDPWINALGGALVIAADGIWDSQTWLHGAVGWRMPLAGWRAAYVGDVLGWGSRARSHFDAYASSQVVGVKPVIAHPSQDSALCMARAEKRWGTQMYSEGYICRNPGRNDQMHHYDMNLNYIDELLWHFQWDADTSYMRRLWPVIERHLAWEKRNFDPDGDHLYDAYCCIWASDALYYSGGAVTHSSAYNYRGNLLAARIAELIGSDSRPYREEAAAILEAMNRRLWMPSVGVWAEYEEALGLQRLHTHPALWSIYTPIDCGAASARQAWLATGYADSRLPHIAVDSTGLSTIATSDWMPYRWSINNVAAAEVMHTALAFFEAGRSEEGFRLLKANVIDQMYHGLSPANFGQVSRYDAARGECYRDFGDCIGISSRALVEGLFGLVPQALYGRLLLRPSFPREWDSVKIVTPYTSYIYTRARGRIRYDITQNFAQPLRVVVCQHLGQGQWREIEGTSEQHQVIEFDDIAVSAAPSAVPVADDGLSARSLGLAEPDLSRKFRTVSLAESFNASVSDIFRQQYLSPRPKTTTLQIPVQGIGEWCHPTETAHICDSVFRSLAVGGVRRVAGVPFLTPQHGPNIVYTSLWDNYPDSVLLPVVGHASSAYLLMAGSTNHMQSRIDNALLLATYSDGTSDTLHLRNPDNWCPIEQDYYHDGLAFNAVQPRPYRVALSSDLVSRDLGQTMGLVGAQDRLIPGGAAQLLRMPLCRRKRLTSLVLRTLSPDVVVGIMALTLQ